jgi:heme/copper-type cytochrome/quinol oxidase subunit 2
MVLVASVGILGGAGFWLGSRPVTPQERTLTVTARKYAYEPAVIRVNKGDTLRLRFASLDAVHGFYLEGYDLDVKISPMRSTVEAQRPRTGDPPETVEEVTLVAERPGKFRYRCSQSCGFMHPFMLGELIVEPNPLLPTSIGMAVGLLLGGFLLVSLRGADRREEGQT